MKKLRTLQYLEDKWLLDDYLNAQKEKNAQYQHEYYLRKTKPKRKHLSLNK